MVRYVHLKRLVPSVVLASAAIAALSAIPAGATIVCPPGVQPPSPYCVNIKPTSVTGSASSVTATSATLNGAAGASVSGGDPTDWFFKYGTTVFYGSRTPRQTLGACPPGVKPPSPYCTTPATQLVAANVSGLTPCTRYHYRLFATNPDGTTLGRDGTFRTSFTNPISSVTSPATVRHGKKFKVTITLQYRALVKILLRTASGRIVQFHNLGVRDPGTFKESLRAPNRPGSYSLEVSGTLLCGSGSITSTLTVT
jgi:hypothetical protein